MKNLRILSLGRNYIKSISGLVTRIRERSVLKWKIIWCDLFDRMALPTLSKNYGSATISSINWKALMCWRSCAFCTWATTWSETGSNSIDCKKWRRWKICFLWEIQYSRIRPTKQRGDTSAPNVCHFWRNSMEKRSYLVQQPDQRTLKKKNNFYKLLQILFENLINVHFIGATLNYCA